MHITVDLSLEAIERFQMRAELENQSLEAYIRAFLESQARQWADEQADKAASDTPEGILDQAVHEMKENQVKNRELAVYAITQKNNLQAEVEKQERIIAELERKAVEAAENRNQLQAWKVRREIPPHEKTLESLRTNLVAAMEAVEKINEAIQREEERIRVRTAEAMALKAAIKAGPHRE
jgi:phage shock protein A